MYLIAKVVKNGANPVVFLKSLVVFLSFGFIYYKVFLNENFHQFADTVVYSINYFSLLIFTIVLLGTFFNWTLEAVKWRAVTNKFNPLDLLTSLRSVLAGVSIGLFTPNRIGEYGGRILYLEKDKRLAGVVGTFAGNFSQMLVTFLIGLLAGFIFLSEFYEAQLLIFASILLISVALLLLLYVKKLPDYFNKKLKMMPELKTFLKTSDLLFLIALSFSRYFIFFFQFFVLLGLFDVFIDIFQAFILIPLIYFSISFIPSFALTEWGVRGSSALFFLGSVSDNYSGILAASTMLWIINICVPALSGVYFIARLKSS